VTVEVDDLTNRIKLLTVADWAAMNAGTFLFLSALQLGFMDIACLISLASLCCNRYIAFKRNAAIDELQNEAKIVIGMALQMALYRKSLRKNGGL
jgi:hypothetical protein